MKRISPLPLLLATSAVGCVGYVGKTSPVAGAAGTSANTGTSGTTGAAGTTVSGTSGTTGAAGTTVSGTAGTTGAAGTSAAGTSGTVGRGGATGNAGTVGTGGTNAAGCPPVCGPSVTDFFDNNKLATFRITFDQADTGTYAPAQWLDLLWSKWNHCPPFDASDLVKVTFQYESPDGKGNATLQDVGMRLRGSMRRDYNELAGFKLDIQKLLGTATGAARRRFGDNNRVNTLSIERDPSHMVQCLTYKMKRDFGLPAPYCNHVRVFVNGTNYGLMENVEEPDNGRFLAHHFGSTAGETYLGSPSQGDCTGTYRFQDSQAKLLYSGATFSSYTSQYKITRGSTATAEQHLLPMLQCGDATQTPSDATFQTCISEWLDVDEWLKEIAAESIIPSMEGFMVQRNLILYFVPDAAAPHGGRFQLSEWDLDRVYNSASCYPSSCDPFTATASYYGPAGTRAKLATRLTTVFKSRYCQALRDFVGNVYKTSTVDAMAAVIAPAMASDPTTTMAAWQTAVDGIKTYITSRTTAVMNQINTACTP
jgi:spore coat protein CotH